MEIFTHDIATLDVAESNDRLLAEMVALWQKANSRGSVVVPGRSPQEYKAGPDHSPSYTYYVALHNLALVGLVKVARRQPVDPEVPDGDTQRAILTSAVDRIRVPDKDAERDVLLHLIGRAAFDAGLEGDLRMVAPRDPDTEALFDDLGFKPDPNYANTLSAFSAAVDSKAASLRG